MQSLRSRLAKHRDRLNILWEVIERDYVLSWILAAIAATDTEQFLVFKGGTALKKCYFRNYRFSEDLDFTVNGTVSPQEIDELVQTACRTAEQMMRQYSPSSLSYEKYREKSPHPHGQQAYTIRAKLPWHADARTPVKVEISTAEQLIRPSVMRPIFHEYGETIDQSIPTYSLEEVIAEKLRAILEHTKKVYERGWTRSRARDYYDLWQIFTHYRDHLDLTALPSLAAQKCQIKDMSYGSVDDFFREKWIASVRKRWTSWLKKLTPNLPPCDEVLDAVRNELATIFMDEKSLI